MPGSPLNGTSPARGRGSSAGQGRTGAVADRSRQGPVPAPGGRKREGPSPGWAETASAGSGRQSRLGPGPKGRALPQVRHRRHGPLHDRADDCAWTTGGRLDLRVDRDHGLQRLREGGDGLGPAPGIVAAGDSRAFPSARWRSAAVPFAVPHALLGVGVAQGVRAPRRDYEARWLGDAGARQPARPVRMSVRTPHKIIKSLPSA